MLYTGWVCFLGAAQTSLEVIITARASLGPDHALPTAGLFRAVEGRCVLERGAPCRRAGANATGWMLALRAGFLGLPGGPHCPLSFAVSLGEDCGTCLSLWGQEEVMLLNGVGGCVPGCMGKHLPPAKPPSESETHMLGKVLDSAPPALTPGQREQQETPLCIL